MASSSPSPRATTNIRTTKRKLADAFEVLDNAVSLQKADNPPPPKRTNTTRSLYSTLAKYGIKSKESDKQPSDSSSTTSITKSTPHLSAILSRAATRTKKVFPFKMSIPSQAPTIHPPPNAEYRPSSLPSFLSRLATFKLATYANKPPAIDAVASAKCGWTNDGKDRLVCGICHASWVVAGREGMSRDAGNALIEKQKISLVSAHKDGCPWKTRQCDSSIYCIPLKTPVVMIRQLKTIAVALDPVLQNIAIKHPLSSTQAQSLRSTLSEHDIPCPSPNEDGETSERSPFTAEPSDAAVLASLFGWSLVPPIASESLRRSSTTSRLPSAIGSRAATPSLTRASTVSRAVSREKTPTIDSPQKPFAFKLPANLFDKKVNAILQCALCQRRIGLWAFISRPENETEAGSSEGDGQSASQRTSTSAPARKQRLSQRQFDLLKEHRSYCPYVVRSTAIPSLSSLQSDTAPRLHESDTQLNGGTMEGWKAVLTVVLRHGMVQRQKAEYQIASADQSDAGELMDVDGVKAMVEGVKSRGGRDLLKYVKGLLG